MSRVHWVRPEMVAEVIYLTWTEDNLLREVQREDKPARQVVLAPEGPRRNSIGTYLERCRRTSPFPCPCRSTSYRLKRRWQRGLAVEHALILLLIAFSAFQFPFGRRCGGRLAGGLGARALSSLSVPVESLNFANVR